MSSRRLWFLPALVRRWFDSSAAPAAPIEGDWKQVEWARVIPFIAIHVLCLGVIFVGWSPIAVAVAAALYVIRMFAVTAFYHRYFSHRTFRTSRFMQFVFAVAGNSCVQRGPLWWAAHHRHHHRHSDTDEDLHSPNAHGFFWSHVGWITTRRADPTNHDAVRDLARYPELRFLDRFDGLVPLLLGASLWGLGAWLEVAYPGLGTSGAQMFIWGFAISTVVLFHASCTINSLAHVFGKRRYATRDDSRNSWWLAVLTFGEGWHNNHHHYPNSARQGFRWWQIDLTYYGLKTLSWLGLIRDLKPVPQRALEAPPPPESSR